MKSVFHHRDDKKNIAPWLGAHLGLAGQQLGEEVEDSGSLQAPPIRDVPYLKSNEIFVKYEMPCNLMPYLSNI